MRRIKMNIIINQKIINFSLRREACTRIFRSKYTEISISEGSENDLERIIDSSRAGINDIWVLLVPTKSRACAKNKRLIIIEDIFSLDNSMAI